MTYFFMRLMHPWIFVGMVAALVLSMIVRKKVHKNAVYRYSLGQTIKNNGFVSVHPHKIIFYWMRCVVLLLLALASAHPQIVDSRSQLPIEGIDIVLVLDVSGSMHFQDYEDDPRSRLDIAKAEAIRFIDKRDNDAMGLVIFGADTLSRCPITFDKRLLKEVVGELQLGVISPDGTMLIRGMVTAANRLKNSQSKSKIMIVLTDGEPSEGDMDPSVVIDVAKKLDIKIYTVGIGSEDDQYIFHPFYGHIPKPKVNRKLLTRIAQETGGEYFMARNAHDMRSVYDTIDRLEKTEHDVPVFSVYYDLLYPLIALIMSVIFCQVFLSTYIWFGL